MELHERIAAARKTAGITQEQLGERVGVTRQAVSKWESGQAVPDALTVIKLCQVLEVSADDLLGLDAPPQTPPEPVALPGTCPCCGRTVPGTVCTVCGYALPSQPERGPRYALILRRVRLVIDPKEAETLKKNLATYCGVSEEYGQMYLDQLQEYGTQIAIRRGMSNAGVRWLTSHLDRDFFQMTIVEDCGESDETLVMKAKAMELPPADKQREPLSFGAIVGAVIVGIIATIVLLSLF